MQVTLVQYPPRLMGDRLRKGQVFLSGINGSKRARISELHMKIMLITFSDIKGVFTLNSFHKARQSTKLTDAVT